MERVLLENGIKDVTKAFAIIDKFKKTDRDQFFLDLEELGMPKTSAAFSETSKIRFLGSLSSG